VLCGAVVAGVGVHCCKILVPDKLQSTMKSHTVHIMLCDVVVVDVGYFITAFKYILMIDANNKCFIPESAACSASLTVRVGLMMAMT
jgi:hypothetical protein